MRINIKKGARLTVQEDDRVGPIFRRWHPPKLDRSSNAPLCSGGRPSKAMRAPRVGGPSPDKRPRAVKVARRSHRQHPTRTPGGASWPIAPPGSNKVCRQDGVEAASPSPATSDDDDEVPL
jgi:hypothetical protein